MATLTGNTIKDTYKSLIKVNDNGELAASLQELTDGVGNGSGVSLNTTGDLKAEGTIEFGSLKDTGEDITITKFVDEADGIANNDNDTTIPTSAAIVDYVASRITLEDLDFAGDTGTGSVDLDGQVFTIAGGTGLDTTASGQTLTVNIDSTVATLTGTQTLTNKSIDLTDNTLTGTLAEFNAALSDDDFASLTGAETLTNKTIDADNNTISNLEVNNLKSGVLDTDLTTVSASDDTLASAKAIKTYVDANITAQDLDITDGTTTSAVDLDSQTMTIQGTANEVEVSLTDQTFTVGLPDTINANVTGAVTGNADTASTLETARDIALSGDVAGSASFDGSANITIAATIQPNSVALGTDTTGDYVANLGTGTGVTIGSNTGEGSAPTIAVNYGSTANTAVQGNTEITISGTTNEIEITGTANQALGGAPSYTIGLPDDVTIGGSLIVSNDLTVNGTTTTVNTQTLSVEDPLIALAIANDANSVDTGFYAKYSLDSGVTSKFAGLFKDASDTDTFKLFKGLEVEPTTTVNTSGTGYALADLDVAGLSASSGVISGDLTVDTNTLYVDSTNNRVGIGTTSPTSPLHVVNTSNGWSAYINNDAGSGTQSGLLLDAGSSSSDFAMYVRNAAGSSDLFAIKGNGNIGINTASPASTLNISHTDAIPLRIARSTAGQTAIRLTNGSSNNVDFTNDGSGNFTISNAGSERMRIDSSGNVGIGISSGLTYPLTIQGATGVNNSYIHFVNATTGSAFSDGTQIGVPDGESYFLINQREASAIRINVGGSEAMRIRNEGDISFRDTSNNEAFYWDASAASLGIGTDSPVRKLDVDSGTSSDIVRFGNDNGSMTFGQSASLTSLDLATSNAYRIRQGASTPFYINTSGNVGIGTTSPNAELEIHGNLNIGDGTSVVSIGLQRNSANYITATDAAGYLVFRTGGANERMRITSGGAIHLSQGTGNSYIGTSAGNLGTSTGTNNTGFGVSTLPNNTTGFRNTAIGTSALNSNTIGIYNTATGYSSLVSNTTGNYNTANGNSALYSNTTGVYNIGIGSFAGFGITTGARNVFIGYSSGNSGNPSYSTGLGMYSLYSGGGGYNVALGYETLYDATTGVHNIATGYQSLSNVTTGSYNVGYGTFTGLVLTTGERNTFIGYSSGKAATGSYNVGVGMSSLESMTSGINNVAIGYNAGDLITTGGNNVCIGHVSDPSSATVSNEITLGSSTHTALRCNVQTISSLSDARDKTNVEDLPLGLDFVDALRPVKFDWDRRDGTMSGVKDAGFIAQELDEAQSQYGCEDYLGLVYKSNPEKLEASYGKLVPVLVKAIQELKAEVESLKSQIS